MLWLAASVTTMLSSPVYEYLRCPQVGCLHPCRNFGGVANDRRGCPFFHDTDVSRKNKVASGRYERPFGPLRQMGLLRGAQVEEDAPQFGGAIGAPVTDPPRKRVPDVGWPTAKGAPLLANNRPCLRLFRLHEVKSG